MTTLVAVIGTFILVAFAAIMAAIDTSVRLIGRGRVHRLTESGVRGAKTFERLVDRPGHVLAAAALMLGIAYAGSAALAAWALAGASAALPMWSSAVFGALVGVVLAFIFGEALPRTVALANPEDTALALAPVALRVSQVLYPIARGLSWLWTGIVRLVGDDRLPSVPWVTTDDYLAHGADEDEDHVESAAEEALISAVTNLHDKVVREIMVPRTDMHCLEDTATLDEALALVEQAGHSRMPVYHETLDDIRGILYAKDLLLRLRSSGEADFSPLDLAREALFVPETKPIDELLVEMRTQAHLAIVADEYGGTAGLVSLEDIIEEIVGEIFDEYDRPETLLEEIGEDIWRADARLPVSDLNDAFGTAIELDADSIGGVFTELAGRIPDVGDTVEVEGLELTVERLEGTRLLELTVRPARKRAEGGDDNEENHAG